VLIPVARVVLVLAPPGHTAGGASVTAPAPRSGPSEALLPCGHDARSGERHLEHLEPSR